MTDETDEMPPEGCDSCRFETALKRYDNHRSIGLHASGPKSKWLCELCASTMAGNAHEYPEQYRGERATLQTLCYVGNAILTELRKGKS